jgi:curved DNA-binding protein CbpA
MTLYEELNLTPDCSFEEVKQQYRILARIHHPDLGGDEEKFKRIKLAYEILSDPESRKQYDETKTTSQPIVKRTEAIQELANIFNRLMANFDSNSNTNLIQMMHEEILRARLHVLADIAKCESYIKNLETVNNKVKVKDDSDGNIIESFVKQQIEWRNRDLDVFKMRLEITDIMTDILNNYDYGFLELFHELVTET